MDKVGTGVLAFKEEFNPVKVSKWQYYGNEINNLTVSVVKTAFLDCRASNAP